MRKVLPISRGGQISIPAEIRHRWGASRVLIQDEGDRLVLKPAPEDPIAAARGRFPLRSGMTIEQMVAQGRLEEQEAEDRKWREYYGGPPPWEREGT